jgi:uncharacterized protein (DUF2342 family)
MGLKPISINPNIKSIGTQQFIIQSAGENNVQCIPLTTMTDISGNDFQVPDNQNAKNYGIDKANDDLSVAQYNLDNWTEILKDPETYVQSLVDNAQVEVDKLNEIKNQLEGVKNGTNQTGGTDGTTTSEINGRSQPADNSSSVDDSTGTTESPSN